MAVKSAPTLKKTTTDPTAPSHSTEKQKKTGIVVKYNCGFENHLTIRGTGAPRLSWDKGIPLKNITADEWFLEIEGPFNTCEFKVLLNDVNYESGPNHLLNCGTHLQYTPSF